MASECGADALKLQTYTADTMTIDMKTSEFLIEGGLWGGQSLYELYSSAYMPWDWHKPLFEYAKELNITIFSSPFDKTAVDFLEDFNPPAYKIASFETIDLPLIKYVAQTKKPMIISTGLATLDEIEEAVGAARDGGCKELALLHCVSSYPAPLEDSNLFTIIDMQKRFDTVIGLSDHTIENITAVTSIGLGSSIIEKHVTLNRNSGGPDDSFSLESNELLGLCQDTNNAWKSLGEINYGLKPSEKDNIKFRRSLFFVKDLNAGQIITNEDVKSIRPGYGLPPKFIDDVVGKVAIKNINRGTSVQYDMFNDIEKENGEIN
jgi:N-acetylneuraminate synthase